MGKPEKAKDDPSVEKNFFFLFFTRDLDNLSDCR